MAITHVFKDGTTSASTACVKVPAEIVKEIVSIARTKTASKKKGEK